MLEPCGRVLRAILGEQLHVIHHWDTDGIASAALVVRRAGERVVELGVPRIGSYSWRALPEPQAESVLVLDYGISGVEYEAYHITHGIRLYVVDHHKVSPPRSPGAAYCNPPALGLGSEEEYPSCAQTLASMLPDPTRSDLLLAALGTVGDLAPQLDAGRMSEPLERARRIAESAGYTLADLRRAVEMLDASYKLLDTACIREATLTLASGSLESVLGLECVARNYARARRLLAEALERLEPLHVDEELEVYALKMDALVTSTVGRRLASSKPGKIVALLHTMPSRGRGYLYIRSITRPLAPLREALESKGLRVGGKSSVLVVEYKQDDEHRLAKLLATITRSTRMRDPTTA